MNPKIENFKFVEACLHWTNKSLTEISLLNKERSPKEIELVNGPPFQFYRISLHYMFTMEYIKLTESDNDRFPSNHFASLEKLSKALLNEFQTAFEPKHKANLVDILVIKSSAFYKKLKGERDSKFAHTDASTPAPFTFHSFSEEEIKEAYNHLSLFNSIMDRCTGMYDYSFAFQHTDTQTDNFIKFHTNYKEYYYANYMDALSKGFH